MTRAVLVDLDGTLVDSAAELRIAVNRVRQGFGLRPASLDAVQGWVGEGVDALIQNALGENRLDSDRCKEARAIFDLAYSEVLGTLAQPYPGVAEGLVALHAQGIPVACVTNKPQEFALELLERLLLLEPIALVVGGDTTDARKPNPAPVVFAAEWLGVRIDDCLMIGDSAIDVDTARNAGCPVWCVRTGYDRSQPVDTLGADAVFDGLGEAVDALRTRAVSG